VTGEYDSQRGALCVEAVFALHRSLSQRIIASLYAFSSQLLGAWGAWGDVRNACTNAGARAGRRRGACGEQLEQYKGKWTILLFYPKVCTCTYRSKYIQKLYDICIDQGVYIYIRSKYIQKLFDICIDLPVSTCDVYMYTQ
jgi:hypothetical protein